MSIDEALEALEGDPRINLPKDGNQAKPYQIEQVIQALKKLREQGT